MILDKIVQIKKEQVERLKERLSKKPFDEKNPPKVRDFAAAISKQGISLIAELKQRSPSAGVIVKNYEPKKIAKTYERAGASAISVLTDLAYFNGKIEDLTQVKTSVQLPVLRKDFIIDEAQIFESYFAGADAVLLIVRILKQDMLKKFINTINDIGMSALVEVHSEDEAKAALDSGAEIIGINNRDLDTLKIDLDTTGRIISNVPEIKGKVIVSESGIKDKNDIQSLVKNGVNAVLIGEAILKSNDISAKIKELTS